MDEKAMRDEFYVKDGGEAILKCIQCATCSGSCPLAADMDHGPRELFALIREGDMEEALRSNTIWNCVSCYQCAARCPREIPVTDLIYALKRLALRHKVAAPVKTRHLYESFAAEVKSGGRISEARLMARHGLRHPLDAMANTFTGLKLARRGRMDVKGGRMSSPEVVRRLLEERGVDPAAPAEDETARAGQTNAVEGEQS